MALTFSAIDHSYEATPALHGVSFTAGRGSITCLLGPSGCGKTTLLNLTAGVLQLQSGKISLDDSVLADPSFSPPPEQRPVGLVFQDGALFPHMTVGENVSFGLKGSGGSEVDRLLKSVGLEGFADRRPAQLSGGQQQRVALIRALATHPAVVLMDEPFANIDNQLRRRLREETRSMLKASNTVSILVTHDPDEAIEIADEIVIMEAGRILQSGTPTHIYSSPQTTSVATMFGNGQVVTGELTDNHLVTSFGIWPLECLRTIDGLKGSVDLVVRPEAVSLIPGDLAVTDRRSVGPYQRVMVTAANGATLVCHEHDGGGAALLENVSLSPAPGSVFGFPKVS